jgi:hypothetical protein
LEYNVLAANFLTYFPIRLKSLIHRSSFLAFGQKNYELIVEHGMVDAHNWVILGLRSGGLWMSWRDGAYE